MLEIHIFYLPYYLNCSPPMAIAVVYVYVRTFFFQAEDGIRDLVRSRGLGDVYKRQIYVPSESRDSIETGLKPNDSSLCTYLRI